MGVLSVGPDWASVTLSSNELWQARIDVIVTAESGSSTSMNTDNGLFLKAGEVINFASGDTVYYRSPTTNVRGIWRETRA